MRTTTTYSEWAARTPISRKARTWLRDQTVRVLSTGRRIDTSGGWIRFPYYHHVFSDERLGFERQLDHLRKNGDFVSLDRAIDMLTNGAPIDGRYFCITFDDGLKSCVTGALPVLAERSIPAAFYVVSDLVGRSFAPKEETAREVFGFMGHDTSLEFMSWSDLAQMIASGMTIGSHGHGHRRLGKLGPAESETELRRSKEILESALGIECRHFCAPYGLPDADFDPARDPALARRMGYRSFATGRRGPNRQGSDPFSLRRDQMLAGWELYQLDYFLSRP